MTGWILFALTLVAAAVATALMLQGQRRAEADAARAKGEAQAELADVKAQARSRVERLEREAERAQHDSRDALLGDLFPAVDALTLARDGATDPQVQRGLDLALGEFERALARHGVTRVTPEPGAAFDPDHHEAVEMMTSETLEAGAVGRCHRAGWAREGRVLRPALVGVVRAEEPAEVVLDAPADEAEEVAFAEPEPAESVSVASATAAD